MPVWMFKLLLVLLLLFIVVNLGLALFKMVRTQSNQNSGKSMSHYLGRRVLLSAAVVLLLLIALGLGWITPNPRPY